MAATMKVQIFLTLSILAAILLFSAPCIECHGHSHDEPSEPAANKYGRAVNEEAAARGPQKTAETHSHSHSHGSPAQEDQHHGHAHDSHGHSHDEHKHEGHGHSHGAPERSFKKGQL